MLTASAALGTAIDMWSVGCILVELALHRPLFPCHTPSQLLQQVSAIGAPSSTTMLRLCSPVRVHLGRPCRITRRQACLDGLLDLLSHLLQMAAMLGPLPEASAEELKPTVGRHQPQSGRPTTSLWGGVRSAEAAIPSWREAMPPIQRELMRVDLALADLVMRMLAYTPSQRISAAVCLPCDYSVAKCGVWVMCHVPALPGRPSAACMRV